MESTDNRTEASRYLDYQVNVSFPEISQSIRTKRAAHNVLAHQKNIINHNFEAGQLDEKEYLYLKRKVDKNIIKLNEYSPPWVMHR